MIDANQVWDVSQAIAWVKDLEPIKPWFIEEPTAPDDILGHAAVRKALKPYGIGVATGEHAMVVCNNSKPFASTRSFAIVAAAPDVDSKAQFTVPATLMPRAAIRFGIRRERACAKNMCCCYCMQ